MRSNFFYDEIFRIRPLRKSEIKKQINFLSPNCDYKNMRFARIHRELLQRLRFGYPPYVQHSLVIYFRCEFQAMFVKDFHQCLLLARLLFNEEIKVFRHTV